MISDREVFKQMLERDVINIYRQLPNILGNFGINVSPYLGLFEDKILSYTDVGIDTAVTWLFGAENPCDIDEAADMAKMMVNDKIEEYRKRVREARENNEENTNNL